MSGARRADRGSATVWVAALLVLVVTATVLAVGEAAAVTARHTAQLAADLAAIAGAGRIGIAPDDVCAAASRAAATNGAAVTRCVVALDGVRSGEVRVEVDRPGRFAGFVLDARARARAARVPGATVAAALGADRAAVWQHGGAARPVIHRLPIHADRRRTPSRPMSGRPTWT